jgi:hypothetical protein
MAPQAGKSVEKWAVLRAQMDSSPPAQREE